MRKLVATTFFAGALILLAQSMDPARTLFDAGVHNEQLGHMLQARLCFTTLVRTYNDGGESTIKAKSELGAVYIYEEAQSMQTKGDARGAYDTYLTVVRAWPESALAPLASAEMKALDPDGRWRR